MLRNLEKLRHLFLRGFAEAQTHGKSYKISYGYKLDIVIYPNWNFLFESIVGREHKFSESDFKKAETVFRECYQFTVFYDGVTGQEIIWSRDFSCFLDETKVVGALLPDDAPAIAAVYKHLNKPLFFINGVNHTRPPALCISPSEICILIPSYEGLMRDDVHRFGNKTEIPFDHIKDLLVRVALARNGNEFRKAERKAVKTFPFPLQALLEENNVKYTPFNWSLPLSGDFLLDKLDRSELIPDGMTLYDSDIDEHIFESETHSLHIRIMPYQPKTLKLPQRTRMWAPMADELFIEDAVVEE